MLNQEIALASLPRQTTVFKKILLKNHVLVKVLKLLKEYRLPNWYIGGGAIPQIAWNHYHGLNPNHAIIDYDIVYFDKSNLAKSTEQEIERKLAEKYPRCPVKFDVKNEARTHLWYEQKFGRKIESYTCTEHAIYSFPTTASAIGVTLNQSNRMEIFAPHGLTDLLGLIVRANKIQIAKQVYENKCKRWKKVWPKLTIIPWEYRP